MDVREKTKNDKRLIDANAFLKDILTAGIGKTIIEYSESDIGYMIRKRPTVDAVPVVRCKDCIYSYEEFGFIYCTFGPYGDCAVPSQFYCAEGKRKEDK